MSSWISSFSIYSWVLYWPFCLLFRSLFSVSLSIYPFLVPAKSKNEEQRYIVPLYKLRENARTFGCANNILARVTGAGVDFNKN